MLKEQRSELDSIVDILISVLEKLRKSYEEANLDCSDCDKIQHLLMYADWLIRCSEHSSSDYEQYWEQVEQAIDDFGLDIGDIKKIVLRINTGTIANQVVHITL